MRPSPLVAIVEARGFSAPRTKGEVMATLVTIGYPEEATAGAVS